MTEKLTEKMTPGSDFFTTYMVDSRQTCHDVRGKSAAEIWQQVVDRLDTEGKEILDGLEYVSIADDDFDPNCRAWLLFTLRGGSEGFYTHLETIRDGKLRKLVLLKTLDGRPSRIKTLESKIWTILDQGD